ncbi:PepSY domain-containing protein [Vibrio sp. Of7-15]|uniref:PepSY-associated TM helix domain-containing protein n=1 Tax=Vibrio sp. Of7-15 TaxID=2724879 RepID=UPI001EF2038A|nr:PepSY domain-containing protein [Vibrio sp. Of7-15]MCG7499978.1 PepSY domain-containing protein [Vibrio sp. Of7-15]
MLGDVSTANSNQNTNNSAVKKSFYFTTWRWHFYAGLFVIPFMVMLSITGLIMLYDDVIEQAQYGDIIHVEPQNTTVLVSEQLANVKAKYPEATIKQYITPPSSEEASRFSIVTEQDQGLFITVNPYTGEVLGEINRDDSWYALANEVHGTLLIGDTGDRLIEIAASLSVVLLITGLYMWWPRDNASKAGMLKVRLSSGSRIFWRDLHANLGMLTSLFFVFFLVSGLSWAGIWGGKFVQPWNSFPAEKWADVPLSDATHASMNHGVEEEVPWNLEQTPMPASHHDHKSGSPQQSMSIDSIVAFAYQNDFTRFKVNLPSSEEGVYTVSANTMSGDITDARLDRTTHLDQYTGDVLADVTWQDYSVMAKFMAAGIALHQGDMGTWNRVLNTALCLIFILISVTGAVMWWLRRPKGSAKLVAPPMPKNMPVWKSAVVVMSCVSVLFPMAGITLATVLILDYVVLSRLSKLKQRFS